MTSLPPTHRRLASPVPGEISPDVICEHLFSFQLIWSLKWTMFLFCFFPTNPSLTELWSGNVFASSPPPNRATYPDTKPTVQPFIGPLNASLLYCLVVFEHKSCWNDLWSIIFFTSHHFIWFKPIATVCLKYNKLCFFFVVVFLLKRCSRGALMRRICSCSLYCIYFWDVNYGFCIFI